MTAGEMRPRGANGEDGGIVTGWLVRLLIIMAILGFVGYELVTAGLTAVNLDGAVRDVARAAALRYQESQNIDRAREDAAAVAQEKGIVLDSVTVDGDLIHATGHDQAPTLVLHRIGFTRDWTTPSATARARWR